MTSNGGNGRVFKISVGGHSGGPKTIMMLSNDKEADIYEEQG